MKQVSIYATWSEKHLAGGGDRAHGVERIAAKGKDHSCLLENTAFVLLGQVSHR
jgi:hypothetical protein